MITALLVDDEPKAIERLAMLLESFDDIEVIGTARSADDAERFLAGRAADVVFLDINMPGRLGIELLGKIPAQTKVVFVTAHEGHAVEAFRGGAVDYVLKPFDRDRLAITVDRLLALLAAETAGDSSATTDGAGDRGPGSLTGVGDGTDATPVDDVLWIEAIKNYSRVQVGGRRPQLVRRTMAEWESVLPAGRFGRISRSLIVQFAKVRSTQWQSRDQTLLFFKGLDEPLPIGRTAATRLKELLPVG